MTTTPCQSFADQQRKERLLRSIIKTVAAREDGDPTLRRGHFITKDDKDRMREKVFGYQIKANI